MTVVAPAVLADALVREYLTRHSLTSSLAAFDAERPRSANAISSRSELGKVLGIERYLKKNKEKADPLKTCLEVVADTLSSKEREKKGDHKHSEHEGKDEGRPSLKPMPKKLEDLQQHGSSKTMALKALPQRTVETVVASEESDVVPSSSSSAPANRNATGSWSAQKTAASNQRSGIEDGIEDLMVEDCDEDLSADSSAPRSSAGGAKGRGSSQGGRHIDIKTAAALKKVVFDSGKGRFNKAWMQGFFPASTKGLKYGIVQTAGGPCGVLASVQAHILRHLLYVNGCADVGSISREKFQDALAHALADIFWQAGGERVGVVAVVKGRGAVDEAGMRSMEMRADGVTECLTLCQGHSYGEVLEHVRGSLEEFCAAEGAGVPMALYSTVLSRGIEEVRRDMEAFEGSTAKLMGAHDYCSQEMVNLMLVGRAVPNVFDGVKDLDGMKLTGIHKQGRVGLLSLFEHYKSMEVGVLLKQPQHPIWVVCSESHFSVLFCTDAEGISRVSERGGTVDLWYYDELAKQDAPIQLTVTWDRNAEPLAIQDFDKDLTPPLEHCIRTRWPAAKVDWNGTDPIL